MKSLATRRQRAELKGRLRRGERFGLVVAVAKSDSGGMKVIDLLLAVPGVGQKKAERLMQEAGIPMKNTVARCGEAQLTRLIGLVED